MSKSFLSNIRWGKVDDRKVQLKHFDNIEILNFNKVTNNINIIYIYINISQHVI